jgi:hypothetical protein
MNIETEFPNMGPDDYHTTSEPDDNYNCVAWAIGETDRWLSHLEPYYWPTNVPRSPTIDALVEVFLSIGFEECEDAEVDIRNEKVALFADGGHWSHAARQLENGTWTSKLGVFQDIAHNTLAGLTGTYYGELHCLLRRERQ